MVRKKKEPELKPEEQTPGAAGSPVLWAGLIMVPVAFALLVSMFADLDKPPPRPPGPEPVQSAYNFRGANSQAQSQGVFDALEQAVACDFSEWIGRTVDENILKGLGRPYRVLPPGSAMTMDHSPERINLDLDENGIITRVWCG